MKNIGHFLLAALVGALCFHVGATLSGGAIQTAWLMSGNEPNTVFVVSYCIAFALGTALGPFVFWRIDKGRTHRMVFSMLGVGTINILAFLTARKEREITENHE